MLIKMTMYNINFTITIANLKKKMIKITLYNKIIYKRLKLYNIHFGAINTIYTFIFMLIYQVQSTQIHIMIY